MTLLKLEDFDPNYREILGDADIKGFKVYTELSEQKIGSVTDILVDPSGRFRYLVVDLGLWIFNKQIVLPVGRSRIDYDTQRVYALGLSRKQADDLPQYNDRMLVDYDYEDQVSGIYRNTAPAGLQNPGVRTEEHTAEEAAPPVLTSSTPGDRNSYDYQQDPALYQSQDQILKQYEERLRANKNASQAEAVDFSQQIQAELTQVASPAEVNPVADEAATIVDPAAFLLTSNPIVDQAIDRDGVSPRFRSACLVFNPVAGQNEPEQDLAIIQGILQPYMNLDIRITTLEVDASQLAREAVERGVELLIASGGDGTLSAVAEAVVGTGVPLGVISRGTANAFATALGIPATIEVACETILEGVTRVIDAASCNGKPMVLLAGIGFEAEAVERADREAKNRFGMLAYVLAGVQSLRDMQSFETRIETEDKVITCQAAAVTIANAAPPTSVLAQGPAELLVDDGLLDITLVAPANSISAIAAAYTLLQSASSGTTTDRPDTGYLRARSIKVTTDPPQKVVLDGELIGYTPVEVECIPGGLTILVPDLLKKAPAEKLEGLPGLQIEYKEPPAEQG